MPLKWLILSSIIGLSFAHVPGEDHHDREHHFMGPTDHGKASRGGNSPIRMSEIATRYVSPPLAPTYIHLLRHVPSQQFADFRPSQPLPISSTLSDITGQSLSSPFSPHEKSHSPFEPRFHVEREEISDEEWQQEILNSFQGSGLVPFVFDSIPAGLININFGTHNCVHMGTDINPESSAYEPSSVSWPSKDGLLYTLLLIDVDDQNKLHWLVINIPQDDLLKGDTVAKYSSPTPPLGHTHRYVMIVMSQEQYFVDLVVQRYSRNEACETHGNINLTEFQTAQGLSQPVAVNFFTVSHNIFVESILAYCGESVATRNR